VTAYLSDGKAIADRPQRLANWITGELFRLLYADGDGQDLRQIAQVKIQPAQLAALLTLMDDRVINATTAKKVLDTMYESGEDPQVIVQREGLGMVSDTGAIDAIIQEILDANADAVARFRGGEEKLFGFFMGQTMRAAKGKADPDAVKARLGEMLTGS